LRLIRERVCIPHIRVACPDEHERVAPHALQRVQPIQVPVPHPPAPDDRQRYPLHILLLLLLLLRLLLCLCLVQRRGRPRGARSTPREGCTPGGCRVCPRTTCPWG